MNSTIQLLTVRACIVIMAVTLSPACEVHDALAADNPPAMSEPIEPAAEPAPPSSEPEPLVPDEPAAEPHPAETHYVLGVTRLNAGDVLGATEELREALRVQPDFLEARMSLGTALYQLGDLDGAIEAYQAA